MGLDLQKYTFYMGKIDFLKNINPAFFYSVFQIVPTTAVPTTAVPTTAVRVTFGNRPYTQ